MASLTAATAELGHLSRTVPGRRCSWRLACGGREAQELQRPGLHVAGMGPTGLAPSSRSVAADPPQTLGCRVCPASGWGPGSLEKHMRAWRAASGLLFSPKWPSALQPGSFSSTSHLGSNRPPRDLPSAPRGLSVCPMLCVPGVVSLGAPACQTAVREIWASGRFLFSFFGPRAMEEHSVHQAQSSVLLTSQVS